MNKLLVFQLAIQSSYEQNVEEDAAGDRFDTLQWWFSENETWRIRTFALDLDIHPYRIGGSVEEEVALENAKKHYGDIIASAFVLEFQNLDDPAAIDMAMEEVGGAEALEIAKDRSFAFWNPGGLKYSTKSRPQ